VREWASGALRILERLARVPKSRISGIARVLVRNGAGHMGPARDIPLTELPRPAQPLFEIRDSEGQPPHLDLRPTAARTVPDLHCENNAFHVDRGVVTADLERLVEQLQRAGEAPRRETDVPETYASASTPAA
jgi:hypothetical protein